MDIDEIKPEIVADVIDITKDKDRNPFLKASNFKTEKIDDAVLIQKSNALNMLANYNDSDDESSDSDEPNASAQDEIYRKKSESEDSDSSSSSSDSEDEKDMNEIKRKINESAQNQDEGSSDDDDEGRPRSQKKRDPPKVKGEMLLDELPPIEELHISVAENQCLEIGKVTSIVEQLVLVEAFHNTTPLDIDTILFLDKGQKVLGAIFDVIGQVSAPMYCIRFNSHDDIVSKSININDKVFCAPQTEHTKIVILPNIMSKKGCDASWKHDLEPPDNLREYSDDEEERRVKRQNKKPARNFAADNQNQNGGGGNQQGHQPRREFVRGRRTNPQQQHAFPNHSWHQNLPPQQQQPQQPNQQQNYQFPQYNYWQ